MISVEELIGDLLLRNNCVIVPSFGGFVANQSAAIIDYRNGIITPPRKSVLFNRQLINNDGLLIKELSFVNNIEYSVAENAIKTIVENWNAQLATGERIVLDRIGFIFLDAEKNICFEQDRFFNLLLESYGLGKVHFIAEEDVKLAQHIQQENPILAVEEKPLFTLESSDIDSIINNEEQPFVEIQHPASKKKLAIWKYVAAALIIPIGFYSFWIPMKTNVLESGILSIKDFNPLYKTNEGLYKNEALSKLNYQIKPEESLEKSIQSITSGSSNYSFKFNDDIYINVRLKENTTTTEQAINEIPEVVIPSTTKPIVNATKKSFDFVVGVFSTEENATNLINSLKTKGFNAKIVDKNGELFRVSAGTSNSNEEIIKIKEKALSAGIDGWILKK
jgi:hypothetical protein